METTISNQKLNKRERRAAALLAHYATCERLAVALGMPANKVDGKKISVALLKLEKEASAGTCHACSYPEPYVTTHRDVRGITFDFAGREDALDEFCDMIKTAVSRVFGRSHMHPIPGFFVNRDPRGYALKIDPANAEGKALIESCRLETDWGSYGILSPEITGD